MRGLALELRYGHPQGDPLWALLQFVRAVTVDLPRGVTHVVEVLHVAEVGLLQISPVAVQSVDVQNDVIKTSLLYALGF